MASINSTIVIEFSPETKAILEKLNIILEKVIEEIEKHNKKG